METRFPKKAHSVDPSTRTPEGQPQRCSVCRKCVVVEPSRPADDAPCPHCGSLLWFPQVGGLEETSGLLRLTITDSSIRTNAEAIAVILDRLVEVGGLAAEHRPVVFAALLKREELGPTGIGRGVAIPHVQYQGVTSTVGAVAQFPRGVQFDSLDGKPVHTVCLLVSPANRPGEHLRTLAAVAKKLRSSV